jgi:amidase
MNRRNFLKNGSLAGLSLTGLSLVSCNSTEETKTAGQKSKASPDSFELSEITVDDLQKKMQDGHYTSRSLVQLYLDRIRQIDQEGPKLHSVIEINPDALSIADAMDKERKSGKVRGPLHGIPVLIKDNIDTADKMQTTAGALALEGHIAKQDAFVARKLREAGAVILGKTNLSEWANFRSTRSVSGWSSRGGQTKNPYILDRSPCGSSSGSAVAVAANLCTVAVGTETDGSISCPASINGVVGIKPTVGLVSRNGIIPISKTQDTAGPFGRTVRDAAILLSALTGIDPGDPVTAESKDKTRPDYTRFLDANALKGKRIGVEKTFLKHHESIDALLARALSQMKSLGATIVEVEFIGEYNKLSGPEFEVLKYEFKDGLNKYLATANAKVKSLQDVISFNKQQEAKAMPYFKQEILDSCQKLGGLDSKEYAKALTKSLSMRKFLDDLLQKHQLDALCGPATGASWCVDFVNGDYSTGYGAYGPAAIAGYPSITVPMGDINELPIGLSFIGAAYNEPGLIAMAYAYEQASKNRSLPKFKNTYGS